MGTHPLFGLPGCKWQHDHVPVRPLLAMQTFPGIPDALTPLVEHTMVFGETLDHALGALLGTPQYICSKLRQWTRD